MITVTTIIIMFTGSWLDHTVDARCVFKSNSRSAQILIRKPLTLCRVANNSVWIEYLK